MKPKSILKLEIPETGIQDLPAGEVLKALTKEEAANFAITSNVVNFNEHADDAFVDIVQLNAAGTGNVTSFTNLDKIGKRFIIINTGAGNKTITTGNNIKTVGAAATSVLATNEYVKCFNNGTNIYVESVHKFA